MDVDTRRPLSLDLASTNLDDAEALTAILVAHVVAPTRALFGSRFPQPRRDEDGDFLEPPLIELADGSVIPGPDDFEPAETTIGFDTFIRSWVLFHRLFPQVAGADYVDLAHPEQVYFADARAMARILWSQMATLVGHMFDADRHPQAPDGLHGLRQLQELLRRALTPPEETWWHVLGHMGLRVVDRDAAAELDAILRADTHQRLVWFQGGTYSLQIEREGTWFDTIYDRGVFATVVPETVAGVVALDFVETLRREPTIGTCAECGLCVELTPQQIARHKAGRPVYHPGCFEQHRRQYVRDYQRRMVIGLRRRGGVG